MRGEAGNRWCPRLPLRYIFVQTLISPPGQKTYGSALSAEGSAPSVDGQYERLTEPTPCWLPGQGRIALARARSGRPPT